MVKNLKSTLFPWSTVTSTIKSVEQLGIDSSMLKLTEVNLLKFGIFPHILDRV